MSTCTRKIDGNKIKLCRMIYSSREKRKKKDDTSKVTGEEQYRIRE